MPETKLTWQELNTWKLHELLDLALTDLKKHENTSGCVVNMSVFLWTGERPGDKCQACLAGTVLRHSLGLLNLRDLVSGESLDVRQEARRWVYAIDYLRAGSVSLAQEEMDRAEPAEPMDRVVVDYHDDRDMWLHDMTLLLSDLRAANL
jgi:hypothetical protein